jgi:hypothetical protein
MSPENVEVVSDWLDAWVKWFYSRQDIDGLAELASEYMAPDVIYEEDPVWPTPGPIAVWTP